MCVGEQEKYVVIFSANMAVFIYNVLLNQSLVDFKWRMNLIRLDLDVEKYIIRYLIRVFFLTTYLGFSQAGMKDVSLVYYVFKN